ncbi:conserved hypothetical protein [Beggiatoa sp. PS]|nr:conserved hypothetical protein [Beggiatoa sp. PS]
MTILRDVGKKIQTILGTKADTLGKATDFIKRKRKFTGSTFIKTLVFGWMQKPEATLEELVQAGVLNDIEISAQGLDKRFTPESANSLRQFSSRHSRSCKELLCGTNRAIEPF